MPDRRLTQKRAYYARKKYTHDFVQGGTIIFKSTANAKCKRMRNAECRMRNAECGMRNA